MPIAAREFGGFAVDYKHCNGYMRQMLSEFGRIYQMDTNI